MLSEALLACSLAAVVVAFLVAVFCLLARREQKQLEPEPAEDVSELWIDHGGEGGGA